MDVPLWMEQYGCTSMDVSVWMLGPLLAESNANVNENAPSVGTEMVDNRARSCVNPISAMRAACRSQPLYMYTVHVTPVTPARPVSVWSAEQDKTGSRGAQMCKRTKVHVLVQVMPTVCKCTAHNLS